MNFKLLLKNLKFALIAVEILNFLKISYQISINPCLLSGEDHLSGFLKYQIFFFCSKKNKYFMNADFAIL